jgi:hypothetical protein
MRWLAYWCVVVTVAVMVARATAESHDKGVPAPAFASADFAVTKEIPEGRAIVLAMGILAIAYTFQRAWQNLKPTAAESD